MLKLKRVLIFPLLALVVFCALSACSGTSAGVPTGSSSSVIAVVAAENFYGDLVKQLGGSHVSVRSLLSDPSVDPHEYESNVQDGIAVSEAQIVIENGGGYDTWMDKLLSASPNANRFVITASRVAPHPLPDNPHVWYGVDNIMAIAQSITGTLKKVDSTDAAVFDRNLATFQHSLAPILQKINEIKQKYAGTPVGLTETIYLYQTTAMGLKVVTPFDLEKAIAEGNDPPAASVITANNQVNHHEIKVLIYNEQTITPITTNLENRAKAEHIPIVSVTETMPATKTYQSWMLDQLNTLEQALGG